MPAWTTLKGVTEIGNSFLCDQLKSNLVEFFNWGLLEIGGFTNVARGSGSIFGTGSASSAKLRLSNDPNYAIGRVWEGHRQDWVWQSGLTYPYQPTQISGVYVNNTFYGSGATGTYAHKIDYPNGRVIFNNAISTTGIVELNYSYRYCSFYTSDTTWFKEVLFNSYRVDDTQFLQSASGVWDVLAQNRVQLPAVIVETVPRRKLRPMQLGGGQWVEQDVLFHILSENTWDRDKLIDIITYQKDRTILSFDKNRLAENDAFPLDYNGSLRSGALSYPDLVKDSGNGGYFWKKIFIKDITTQEANSNPPLFRGVVRASFEIDFPEI